MKSIYIFVWLFVFFDFYSFSQISQNLVVNHSFEEYESCPAGVGSVLSPFETNIYCQGWTRPSNASPDHMNACAGIEYGTNVPYTSFGYQNAKTGNAFMGLMVLNELYGTTVYREYIQGQLKAPLTSGHQYYVNYWVNKAENDYYCSVDRLGAIFINEEIYLSPFYGVLTDYTSSITSPEYQYFEDTMNWESVNGMFEAAGGEEWIILGNFVPLNETHQIGCGEGASHHYVSYFFVDDVCVMDLDGIPYSTNVFHYEMCDQDFVHINFGISDSMDFLWFDDSRSSSYSFSEPGVYWVKKMNKNNCTFSVDTIFIVPRFEIEFSLGNDTTLCSYAVLEIGGEIEHVSSYLWNTGETTPVITVTNPGLYVLKASTDCHSVSDSIMVRHYDRIRMSLPDDTVSCDAVKLIISPDINLSDNVIYQWSDYSSGRYLEILESGTYHLTVTDACGFSAKDTIAVDLIDCNKCFLMPNAFSPNGDGHNDVFYVLSSCDFFEFNFKVFNRWGEAVFSSDKITEGWNGYYKGIPADAGVYFYVITALPAYPNSKSIQLNGDVLLLR